MKIKGSILGQAITSAPAMILVFLIMVIFVAISGFFAKDHSPNYSLADDFLNDYVAFNKDVVTVSDAIKQMCSNESLESDLKRVLKNHFVKFYGYENAFVLTSAYGDYTLHAWSGVFDERFAYTDFRPSISVIDFLKEFPDKASNVEIRVPCPGKTFALYVRSNKEVEL
jgi:hypothetical protein